MGRQVVVRTLVAVSLLVVVAVLGVAVKIGRDTSQYLQTVSSHRDWRPAEKLPVGAAAVGGGAPTDMGENAAGAGGADGAVASR